MREIDTGDLQLIHANERFTLHRTRLQQPSLVLKSTRAAPADPAAAAVLTHEYELLRGVDLAGVVRVVKLTQTDDAVALVMEDAGSQNLAARVIARPLPVAEFWEIASQLATALGGLHQAGIIHCNIQPGNIVWDEKSCRATLIDFGIALSLSTSAARRGDAAGARGSLTYMSPEQTGRTGWTVDSRADLYSLGATFYTLLTGSPPFTSRDPIELTHAHLARAPKPPHAVNGDIPPVLSDIILRLLEKDPDQRYLTASGLLADLRSAGEQWARTGAVLAFPLAEHDVPHKLSVSGEVYGRTAELDILYRALDRVSVAQRELILVAGATGIGKSVLVNHLDQPTTERSGYFVAGKFDQLQRGVPYDGLVQAFRMLVRTLLAEPEAALAAWRARIQAAVAPNAKILVDVIPEIENLLGPQAAVAALGPVESRNRFTQVFTSFLNVFARAEHPFVLFLDDVQWVDAASLQLIEQWVADRATGHVLIVAAYREEEVGLAHPLALAVTELRRSQVKISDIHLQPLSHDHVAQLLSTTLNQSRYVCLPLAELIVRKTAGNPFFIKRLLHALHGEGLIRFNARNRSWRWDIAEIERAPVSDNVLHLMLQAIDRLSEPTRNLLQIGACIGHRFDLATLADVAGHSPTAAMHLLWPAVEDGLLLRLHELDQAGQAVTMQFAHDRVQQAAYTLLPEAARGALHLDIGRRLLSRASPQRPDGQLFDVVDHLNRGVALIADAAERLRVAELNLAAGRKAKAAAAYQAGMDYLSAGQLLLPVDAWTALPELSFAIHRELAECAYLTGRHAAAEDIIEAALERAPTRIAKADLYSLRVLAATVVGDWAAALRWGREGLAVFGHAWPQAGLADANEAESRAVIDNLGGRRIDELAAQPEVADEETRACMRLLAILGPPAYFSGSEVLTFLMARGANLSLLHGPSVYSSYVYVFYGALHNARTGEYEVGYAFGQLVLELAGRFDNRAEESRTLEVFGLVVHVWKARLRDSLPLMREGHRAGVESGELAYAAFNLCGLLINGLPSGVPLTELLADAAVAIEFADKHRNRTAIEISTPFQQFALVMTGAISTSAGFDDGNFNQARFLEEAQGNQTASGQFWIARLQAAYLLGDYAAARRCAQEGEPCVSAGILGMITSAEHAYYDALTLAARYPASAEAERPAMLDALLARRAQFAVWAGHCPENFAHKHKLIAAEVERINGSPWRAMQLFGEAVDAAKAADFIQDAALANELAGKLFLAHGQPQLADVYLRAAIEAYRQWGATAKVNLLRHVHADRLPLALDHAASASAGGSAALGVDALGLIKASQAIAAETSHERLFERILRIAVEVAGAQQGTLLLGDVAALRVRGHYTAADGDSVTLEDTALDEYSRLPIAIVRYVARMKESLVLNDAAAEGAFAADPEVQRLGLRSVLCVPLKNQDKVVGMLYLENNGLARAFIEDRVEVVQVLASQAAVSLQNSSLLMERERAERELRLLANDLLNENRRKTEFLATLAHELRNPLAPIRTGLDLMRYSGNNPATMSKVMDMMGRQVSQMVHLIDDLLDIARINTGKVQLKMQRIDLRDAVFSAVETVTPSIKAARHELDVAMPEHAVLLDADPTRLAQMLGNLLTNATKYTPPGGHIKVAVRAHERSVEVAITDTGIGIPAAALGEVFNMFNQVSKNMGRSQGGLGIGLSLVRGLVQMHGGSVGASSPGEGQGSTFTLRLPLAIEAAPPQTVAPAPATDVAPARTLKVLVADDNIDAANMMMALLQMGGHEVELAHDGRQALEKATARRYDLAILDIGMPGLSGYEVAEAIRRLPQSEPVFLAALTGWGAEEDRSRSKQAGFDLHLTKPAGMAEINQLLALALDAIAMRPGRQD